MLSTNSLSAFSAATTTASVQRPSQIRLVREPAPSPLHPAQAVKNAVPSQLPTLTPPRGSLLNLSV